MNAHETPRILRQCERSNPQEGRVVWSPVKSLWFIAHALIAVIGGFLTFRYDAVLLSFVFFVTTMCLGSSIGFHRLLVHRSFECPRWLEAVFVYLGTLAGMGGPLGFLYMHDIRDWSQRHETRHAYFTHQNPLWRDFVWQFFCDICAPSVLSAWPGISSFRPTSPRDPNSSDWNHHQMDREGTLK